MKDFIIILLILLNALYWGYVLVNWDKSSDDGTVGKCICGMILLLFSIGLIGMV